MTKKELIQALNDYPDDWNVFKRCSGDDVPIYKIDIIQPPIFNLEKKITEYIPVIRIT